MNPDTDNPRTTTRTLLIGAGAGIFVIAVFVAGWALGGGGSDGLNTDTSASAGSSTSITDAPSSTTLETDNTSVEAEAAAEWSGPQLGLNLEQLKQRWNTAAEEIDSSFQINEWETTEETRTLDETRVLSTEAIQDFGPSLRLRVTVIGTDGPVYQMFIEGGERCPVVLPTSSTTAPCEGTFDNSAEDFRRYLTLLELAVSSVHPGVDTQNVMESWAQRHGGLIDSDTGYLPEIDGIGYIATYNNRGYLVAIRPPVD